MALASLLCPLLAVTGAVAQESQPSAASGLTRTNSGPSASSSRSAIASATRRLAKYWLST